MGHRQVVYSRRALVKPSTAVLLTSAAAGGVAGAVLVTLFFFRYLGARLGPPYDGRGESGLYVLWTVPQGGAAGTVLGLGLAWATAFVFSRLFREADGLDSPELERHTRRRRYWFAFTAVILVSAAFVAGCLLAGFLMQATVR